MRILLAIDSSKCSESAVETLLSHYTPGNTEVLVLHAVESAKLMPISFTYGIGPMFVQDYEYTTQQWRKQGKELVERTASRLRAAGFKANTQVEEGDARELILDCAKKWQPDLILVGSHGKRGLDRLLLGSVSEAIARHAPCSVEIVREAASAA